ncbi:MAG: 3-phosphoshikimate 1-carboxyvinyltransferase [Lachnospiraceae bacterium]|nr:3-phosphoshikimate 1-carboxyvinyltransferase [Lachnospiraceae bacterium]
MIIKPIKKLKGEITIPGDKSISHRSVMFGAISEGLTEISDFLEGADCLSTIDCFKKLGIEIEKTSDKILVHGKGLHGLKEPAETLYTGNSGTTTRLISGILSGQPFATRLTGDESIQKRPMRRVITPLSLMGADISSEKDNDCAPLLYKPAKLKGISYDSPVASAQVKSAILLAGLYAEGTTKVHEKVLSRNHTELMLKGFGADISSENNTAKINPGNKMYGQKISVPGDISSAAYFIAAGLITKDSEILIKNVGVNPTRDGILKVVLAMGANIEMQNQRIVSGEPVCDLLVKESSLHGTNVNGDIIPTLIDELPMIAVLAAFADGKTVISDAAELRVKESNRIDTVVYNLKKMGADITPTEDGFIINGGISLHPSNELDSFDDHRIAMSFAVGSMALDGDSQIRNGECVGISYPGFYNDITSLASN